MDISKNKLLNSSSNKILKPTSQNTNTYLNHPNHYDFNPYKSS